jgi:hypothetical protein
MKHGEIQNRQETPTKNLTHIYVRVCVPATGVFSQHTSLIIKQHTFNIINHTLPGKGMKMEITGFSETFVPKYTVSRSRRPQFFNTFILGTIHNLFKF